MMRIPLGGKLAIGSVALIDDEDYGLISKYRWRVWMDPSVGRRGNGPYAAASTVNSDGRRTTIYMHCVILGRVGVDHRNGNGLDNQRSNLRPATQPLNGANRQPTAGCSSIYKGVARRRDSTTWIAYIHVRGRRTHLGTFADEKDAAHAYDHAAVAAWGEFARPNFPENT